MNDERNRPYLVSRTCGRCIIPLKITEHREGGWLFATYSCPRCGFQQVATFSPAELEEWGRRKGRRPGIGASS